ncbi:PEP/pyruvate-binding domain-containing protein, partial [Propionicimonas sp.]|uniref:PEP/pyruvate-binding domain-containing protein n=1 Tax=Propionicimonas sp. TaxID=1955623 RepID=UPI0039E670AA
MVQEIRWLADLGRADVAVAGGKGANLGELVRGGFPVPDGFVVTTVAYDSFVADHHLAEAIADAAAALTSDRPAGPAASRVADLFGGAALAPDLADAITDAYAQLGGGPVAVRSSATAEDLAEASFAGQQDTYLNVVGAEALLAAVRDCWASLWTDRAIWYRAQHGVGEASLAVVVQRLVPADAAGVMFTANPANGRTEETVITAAWGLGEAVVSGLVDTDTIVVDTDAHRVLSSRVADKAVRIDPVAAEEPEPRAARGDTASDTSVGRGRTRTSQTGAERSLPVLDDAAALRLAALGESVAAHFGAPQDIEWTRAGEEFLLVQSRPITALPPRTGPVPLEWPVPRKGLYFRASITEQLPDPLTPLFAGLMERAVPAGLNRMLAELVPGGESSDIGFPTINGYAFYRYSYSAFGAMLKMTPTAIQKVLGGGGSWIEERWRARLGDYRAEVDADGRIDVAAAPAAELLAAVQRLVDAVAYYYTAVQTIIPLAAIAELTWTGVYDRLLKRPGDPSAEVFLLGYDSEPIRAEKALYDLSRWVRDQPGLAGTVADASADPFADDAPAGVSGEVWGRWRERLAR